jgi:hypothetical protein
MPELPEVETIRRDLEELVVGQVIRAMDVRDRRLVRYPSPAVFAVSLRGQRLVAARRRAKYLLLDLAPATEAPLPLPAGQGWRGPGGLILVVQLMISGQLLLLPPDAMGEVPTGWGRAVNAAGAPVPGDERSETPAGATPGGASVSPARAPASSRPDTEGKALAFDDGGNSPPQELTAEAACRSYSGEQGHPLRPLRSNHLHRLL